MFTRFSILAVVMAALVAGPPVRAAEGRISLVRDAEVENTIRSYATPLFKAAGLDPDAIKVHLVKDDSLNAFVAGGLHMFINTGLLIRSEHPGQVIGVLAHETGHIAGGHLARMDEAMRNATAEAIIAMVLGTAAAVASGRGDVGAGVLMGGSEIAGRSLMRYTRAQEQAADQAAVNLLDSTGQSARGLLEFMDILGDQELLVAARQDPYLRTHPLTTERVTFLRHQVEISPNSNAAPPPEFVEMHKRMRAKLFAFTEPPARVLQRYRENDDSLEARYARAIAYYRKPDLTKALPLIDGLIAERPNDPYFHELKGQMLFENGRPREALESYREAVRLLPNAPLLLVSLAQVEIEIGDEELLREARKHLEQALQNERDSGFAWRLLAVACGRLGDEGMASYAMAEQALLARRVPEAIYHAGRAERLLPRNSPVWLRVQDVKARAQALKEERKEK